MGLGLRYSPVYGLTRFRVPGQDAQGRPRVMRLRSLDLRYAHYQQSTDLVANIVGAVAGTAIGVVMVRHARTDTAHEKLTPTDQTRDATA